MGILKSPYPRCEGSDKAGYYHRQRCEHLLICNHSEMIRFVMNHVY